MEQKVGIEELIMMLAPDAANEKCLREKKKEKVNQIKDTKEKKKEDDYDYIFINDEESVKPGVLDEGNRNKVIINSIKKSKMINKNEVMKVGERDYFDLERKDNTKGKNEVNKMRTMLIKDNTHESKLYQNLDAIDINITEKGINNENIIEKTKKDQIFDINDKNESIKTKTKHIEDILEEKDKIDGDNNKNKKKVVDDEKVCIAEKTQKIEITKDNYNTSAKRIKNLKIEDIKKKQISDKKEDDEKKINKTKTKCLDKEIVKDVKVVEKTSKQKETKKDKKRKVNCNVPLATKTENSVLKKIQTNVKNDTNINKQEPSKKLSETNKVKTILVETTKKKERTNEVNETKKKVSDKKDKSSIIFKRNKEKSREFLRRKSKSNFEITCLNVQRQKKSTNPKNTCSTVENIKISIETKTINNEDKNKLDNTIKLTMSTPNILPVKSTKPKTSTIKKT